MVLKYWWNDIGEQVNARRDTSSAVTFSTDIVGLNMCIGRERSTSDRMSRSNILVVTIQLYKRKIHKFRQDKTLFYCH
jgi:hypothetical protein